MSSCELEAGVAGLLPMAASRVDEATVLSSVATCKRLCRADALSCSSSGSTPCRSGIESAAQNSSPKSSSSTSRRASWRPALRHSGAHVSLMSAKY